MIERWNSNEDGPLTEQAMKLKLENRGFVVNRYVYPHGTYFPDHTHNVDKIDAVFSGEFEMNIEGRIFVLKAGDCISVPKSTVHNARVIGTTSVISFDATKC